MHLRKQEIVFFLWKSYVGREVLPGDHMHDSVESGEIGIQEKDIREP